MIRSVDTSGNKSDVVQQTTSIAKLPNINIIKEVNDAVATPSLGPEKKQGSCALEISLRVRASSGRYRLKGSTMCRKWWILEKFAKRVFILD